MSAFADMSEQKADMAGRIGHPPGHFERFALGLSEMGLWGNHASPFFACAPIRRGAAVLPCGYGRLRTDGG
jgi:hypothetical protein